jgi:hypothetical protein
MILLYLVCSKEFMGILARFRKIEVDIADKNIKGKLMIMEFFGGLGCLMLGKNSGATSRLFGILT